MFGRFAVRKSRTVLSIIPKRKMGGGHSGPPPEGIDAVVRKYLPGNHHIAMAIIGGYFSLYLVSKLFSGKKKPAPPATKGSTSDGAIPSVDSPAFADWLAKDGNIEKALNGK